MQLDETVTIDLAGYGGEGMLIMGRPSFRRTTEIKNEMSGRIRVMRRETGDAVMDGLLQGDLELLSVLLYVRRAPFTATLEGFQRYTDAIEANDPTGGVRLFERMQEAMRGFESGQSPSADSPEAETVSSE